MCARLRVVLVRLRVRLRGTRMRVYVFCASVDWRVSARSNKQEDGSFAVSTREYGPSARPLVGPWWNQHKVVKVLYAKKPDGTRKVSSSEW